MTRKIVTQFKELQTSSEDAHMYVSLYACIHLLYMQQLGTCMHKYATMYTCVCMHPCMCECIGTMWYGCVHGCMHLCRYKLGICMHKFTCIH